MSNTDSFVDEVSEEVRRDRMYALMRRYGWIAVLAVLLLVGGAAYREWKGAQDRAEAQALGDALSAALSPDDSAARVAALAEVQGGAALTGLLLASEQLAAGESAAALETLKGVSVNAEVAPIYQELAQFKAALIAEQPEADRRAALDALAVPGGNYRLLAMEQRALMALDAGQNDAALDDLIAIDQDAETSAPLRERVRSLIVALGAEDRLEETPGTATTQAQPGAAQNSDAPNESAQNGG